jgi:hypothetical protein
MTNTADSTVVCLVIYARYARQHFQRAVGPWMTRQHNSLAHNIKLQAGRLPIFRASETGVELVRQ